MLIDPDPLVERVLGCAIRVHRALGPGLLEATYQGCLWHEFRLRGLAFRCEVPVPVIYEGFEVKCAYRADAIVEDRLLLELKAVERFLPIHHQQTLTYLKLSQLKQGLRINFNSKRLVEGVKRFLL